ncbi:MAG: hypothetical protein DRJ41_04520, partial [Thermoprotei archaeon]
GLEELSKRILEQGKEAALLGDKELMRRQARKYFVVNQRIKQTKRLLLLMEEAELQRELVRASSKFIEFSRDIISSIAEGPTPSEIVKAQTRLEEALAKAESVEEALNTILDLTSEGILTSKSLSEREINELMRLMEEEAKGEEIELKEEDKGKLFDDILKDKGDR